MKLLKILFILTLLVMNHSISSLSTTSRYRHMLKNSGKRNSSKKGKTGRSHTHNKTHSKARTENRRKTETKSQVKVQAQSESYSHSNSLSKTEFTTKTKSIIIHFILGSLSMIETIAGSVLTYYTKIANMKTLDLMKKEYLMNLHFQDKLTENEINACSTLRLMRQTNKFLFTANEFRLIYLEYYIKLKVGNNCQQLKEGEEKSKCLILKSIGSLKEEISVKSPKIMKEIKLMEEKNCNQKSRYDPFAKENDVLQRDIQELQNKIQKEEENLLLGVFGGFVTSVGIGTTQDKNMFMLDTWQIPAGYQFNSQSFTDIAMMAGTSGFTLFRANQLKDKVDQAFSIQTKEPQWKNKLNIVVGFLDLISSASSIIGTVVQGANMLSRVFNFISKFLEFFIATVEYYTATHTKTTGPIEKSRAKNEFYKKLINLGVALLGVAFSTFGNVVSEGLQLIRKTVALIEAKNLLKSQTQRYKIFEKLGQMEVSAAENLKIYSVCKANYLSIKSYYEIFNEIALTESKMLDKFNEEKLEIIWTDIMQNDAATQDVLIDFRKKIKKICAENVQFCSRNFDRKNLEEWLGEDEKHTIDKLAERAIYGPYTDIIVTQTKEEFLAFIQLGYEPIYNTHKSFILGCRMCNNKRAIRFLTVGRSHVSRDGSDLSDALLEKIPGSCSSSPYPCSSLFNDSKCEAVYKSTRLDNYQVFIFEKIPFTTFNAATNEREPIPFVKALAKIFPMDPKKHLSFYPRYGLWKDDESSWKSCYSNFSGIKSFCPFCESQVLTFDDNEIKIAEEKYLGLSDSELMKDKDAEKDQVLTSIPFERELSSHVGGELRYPETRLYFKAFAIPENVSTLSHQSISIHENVDNTQDGFYKVSSLFNIYNNRNPERIQNTPQFFLQPGAYNWLINDQLYSKYSLVKENLNRIAKGIEIHDFVIRRNEDLDVADVLAGNISTDIFTYIFLTFKPFSPNSDINSGKENEDSKRLCENICKPQSSELAVRKKSCNFIDDLSYNDFVFNEEKMHITNSKRIANLNSHQYIASAIDNPEDIDHSVEFKDLSIFENLLYNDLKMFHGNFEKLDGERLCVVKEYEVDFITNIRIGSCDGEEEKSIEDNIKRDYISLKRKDFHSDVFLLFLKGDKTKKDRVKDAVYTLNDYYMLDKFSGKFLDKSHSVYVFIKPLPSSGFAPFHENYKRLFLFDSDGCRDDFLGSLKGKLCFTKNFSEVTYNNKSYKKCIVPDNEFSKYKLYGENLFKISKIKDVDGKKANSILDVSSYFIKDMLHQLDKDNEVRSLKCHEADFFIPVKFHKFVEKDISNLGDDEFAEKYDGSTKSKDKYRAIEVEGEGEETKIVEKYIDVGPGIRSVYWLQFTLSTSNSKNKKYLIENMDIAKKWGYVLHHTIENVILFKHQTFTVNVWVAFDYRLGVKRSDLCTLCSENFTQEKSERIDIQPLHPRSQSENHKAKSSNIENNAAANNIADLILNKNIKDSPPPPPSKRNGKLGLRRQLSKNLA